MQKKKVAILTMNYKKNHGGVLQCIALQGVLMNLGADVEVVKFSYSNKVNGVGGIVRILLNYSPKILFNQLMKKLRVKRSKSKVQPGTITNCMKFIYENINYTSKTYDEITLSEIKDKYELVVIGSDKIWGGINKKRLVYFGDWVDINKTKVISYAACSSAPAVPDFNKARISKLLDRFTAISVRDEHTKNLFQPLTNRDINVVVDPTLLYNYDASVTETPYIDGDYIFVYALGKPIVGGHDKVTDRLRQLYPSCKLVAITVPHESKDVCEYVDMVIDNADPYQWVNLIANAKCVYTDSFHGIIFCMKYRTNFIAYYAEESRSTRLKDLASRYSIGTQIVNNATDEKFDKACEFNIDFDRINKTIDENSAKSLDFLKNIL